MKRFKSAGQGQRRLSAYDGIYNLFRLRRDHLPAEQYRTARAEAFQTWAAITGVVGMAYLSASRLSSCASFCSRPIKLTVPQQQLVVRIVQGRMVQERDFTAGALVEVAKQ